MFIEEFKDEYITKIKARVLPIIKKFNPEVNEKILKEDIWIDMKECDEEISDCDGYQGKVIISSSYMPFMTKEIYDAIIDVLDTYGAWRFTWVTHPICCPDSVELEVLFE